MFDESIFNFVNIALAAAVIFKGFGIYQNSSGRNKSVAFFILLSGLLIGVAEFIDMFQIFPDGTFMANLMYEKEIPVLVFLFMAVSALKGSKK